MDIIVLFFTEHNIAYYPWLIVLLMEFSSTRHLGDLREHKIKQSCFFTFPLIFPLACYFWTNCGHTCYCLVIHCLVIHLVKNKDKG